MKVTTMIVNIDCNMSDVFELINYKERITRKNIEVQNKMHIEVQKGTSHST